MKPRPVFPCGAKRGQFPPALPFMGTAFGSGPGAGLRHCSRPSGMTAPARAGQSGAGFYRKKGKSCIATVEP